MPAAADSSESAPSEQENPPKLVVGLVVDQMRWDYLYRYYDRYGEGGFRRLLQEGFSFDSTYINYLPSSTGVNQLLGSTAELFDSTQ